MNNEADKILLEALDALMMASGECAEACYQTGDKRMRVLHRRWAVALLYYKQVLAGVADGQVKEESESENG